MTRARRFLSDLKKKQRNKNKQQTLLYSHCISVFILAELLLQVYMRSFQDLDAIDILIP